MKQKTNQKWMWLLSLVLVLGFASGCSKDEGFGGNSSLTGVVNHHEAPIPGASVFIKFGAKELPGTSASDFDASTTADATGTYNFAGLFKGNYYLYSIGYDSAISEVVVGGVYVKVESGENVQDLPVTE